MRIIPTNQLSSHERISRYEINFKGALLLSSTNENILYRSVRTKGSHFRIISIETYIIVYRLSDRLIPFNS